MSLNCSEISTYEKCIMNWRTVPRGTPHNLEQICTHLEQTLYVPSIRINKKPTEPFQHVPNRFHSHACTNFFSIRMKISAQSNYQIFSDSNENQSSIKLTNNFWFEWKSELNQTGSNRCIGWYVVITNITQIFVVSNQWASRNQRASST